MTRPPHLLFLDLVRSLAAQAVLIGHAVILAYPGLIGRKDFFYIQSWAVVVFLTLSGYLIALSVKRRWARGAFTLSGYVKDRFARIFVPLLPLVPIVILGDRVFLGWPAKTPYVGSVLHDPATVLANLVMLQDNWLVQVLDRVVGLDLSRRSLGSAAPWWTVALEWWIYLAFGCLFAVCVGATAWRAVALAVGALALFTVIGTTLSGSMLPVAWLVGAGLAWWNPKIARRGWSAIAIGSAGLVAITLVLEHSAVYSLPVVVGTALMIVAAFRASSWDVLRRIAPAITFTAGYSYSLYLIHFSMLVWFAAAAPAIRGTGFIAIAFVACNAAGVACWALFERHFPVVRRWLDRIGPRVKDAGTVDA